MFRKQFRTKSKVQLKSSEQRKLLSEIKLSFPAITEVELSKLSKESISKARVISSNDEQLDVYFIDKSPIFIDIIDSRIRLPTVHFLWTYQNLVPYVTTTNFVIDKLKSGADLFLPGIHKESIENLKFQENDPVAINVETNCAAFCVGYFALDSESLNTGGKVVKICHTVGDLLFKLHSLPLPELGPPKCFKTVEEENLEGVINESLINEVEEKSESTAEKTDNINDETVINNAEENVKPIVEKSERERCDEMLEYCFLKAIKSNPKTIYPILPANFYANYILPAAPEGAELNIKKTSWKKLSVYLLEKVKEGLISVETIQKNEFRIVGANLSHMKVREFCDPNKQIIVEAPKLSIQGSPTVQQVFSVTSATLPFFTKHGYKKADQLTRQDVRNLLNDYVKREKLQDPLVPDKVQLNPLLYDIFQQESLSRGDLLTNLLSKMSVEHKISNVPDGEVHVHKGKMPLVEFNVCTRAGNKKVTLINNLECYGIDVGQFAKELQQKAAASAIVQAGAPGTKGQHVLVQGNQVRQAAQLLKEHFNLGEKFMRGLEKAPKLKK